MTDLSPSKASRSTIPETAELYQLLVDRVQEYAILLLDPTGRVVSCNAGAQRLKGYAAEELVGQHFSVFYPPEDLVAAKPQRELVDATRFGRVEDEGWRVRKDGSRFWANVVITALRNEAGELVAFGKVTRDLTDRRMAEEALRDSEWRFRLLVQSVRDYGIFMLDAGGYVASWNEGAERIKGYAANEIVGRHFSTFYPAEDVARGKPPRELEVAAAEGRYAEEGWRVRKDGTLFWASVTITALRDPTRGLVGFAKVTRDLTERRAAQERAIADTRRVAEAEAANRAKAEFLAAMSHELRTPLNAIGGYAELLVMGLGGTVTEEQRQYLERIRRSQQHLMSIINDLLNFSRIAAGRLALEIGMVPLAAVVESAAPMLALQAAAKGLTLEQAASAADVVARADRAKVEQIVINLLSNAVKFTPDGGRVTLGCATADDAVELRVIDTGPGIPPDKLEAIFDPFVQLGRSLTTGHQGTGLGLAISRDLARAMGGDVTVASVEGGGATFTLRLPAA